MYDHNPMYHDTTAAGLGSTYYSCSSNSIGCVLGWVYKSLFHCMGSSLALLYWSCAGHVRFMFMFFYDPDLDPYIPPKVRHCTGVWAFFRFGSSPIHFPYCTGHVRAVRRPCTGHVYFFEILLRRFCTTANIYGPLIDLALVYLYCTSCIRVIYGSDVFVFALVYLYIFFATVRGVYRSCVHTCHVWV